MLTLTTQPDSEPYARLLAEHATDLLIVIDRGGLLEWANDAFTLMTGVPLADAIGARPIDLLEGPGTDPEDIARIKHALQNRRPVRSEVHYATKSGDGVWVELAITPVFDGDGTHTHFVAVGRDISKRRAIEAENRILVEEEERSRYERKMLSNTSEWLYSAKSMDELFLVISRSVTELMPEVEGQLYIYSNSRDTIDLALHWGERPDVIHVSPDDCWALRRGRAYEFGRGMIEFPCHHASGDSGPHFCLPIVAHGETIGLFHLAFPHLSLGEAAAGTYDTILEQRWRTALVCAEQFSLAIANVRLRMELHDKSVRDQLTGLWNRRWFLDIAQRDLARCHAENKHFGLISIDVDHFKRFNDLHGHDAGDAVLQAVGAQMAKSFKEPLTPCRLGGEEFVVICPGKGPTDCLDMAEAFREQISSLVLRHGTSNLPSITISQGIAVSNGDQPLGLLDQLKLADNALYAAKDGGRNRSVLHEIAQEPILWGEESAA